MRSPLIMQVLVTGLIAAGAHAQTVIRVDKNATGTPDGTSWSTAYRNLQEAIDVATADQLPHPDQIWVAAETYNPDPSDPFVSYALKSGVEIYGGFLGTAPGGGETLLSQRDPVNNVTSLSGNLGGGTYTLTIVSISGGNSRTRLDGFRIEGASEHAIVITNFSQARFFDLVVEDNENTSFGSGAGMSIDGGSTPTVTDSRFYLNEAFSGGAVYCGYQSTPRFVGCRFETNTATFYGGGALYADNGGYPDIDSSTFIDNQALDGGVGGAGGAIRLASTSSATLRNQIRNCQFIENKAFGTYGGVGGAIYVSGSQKETWVVHSLFDGNSAEDTGGAVYVETTGYAPDSSVISCRFVGNIGEHSGGAIHAGGSVDILNSEFTENIAEGSGEVGGFGGAVYQQPPLTTSSSDVRLINCTLNRNEAAAAVGRGGFGLPIPAFLSHFRCVTPYSGTTRQTEMPRAKMTRSILPPRTPPMLRSNTHVSRTSTFLHRTFNCSIRGTSVTIRSSKTKTQVTCAS